MAGRANDTLKALRNPCDMHYREERRNRKGKGRGERGVYVNEKSPSPPTGVFLPLLCPCSLFTAVPIERRGPVFFLFRKEELSVRRCKYTCTTCTRGRTNVCRMPCGCRATEKNPCPQVCKSASQAKREGKTGKTRKRTQKARSFKPVIAQADDLFNKGKKKKNM